MKRIKMYIQNIDKVSKTQDKRTHTTCVPKVKEKSEDKGFDAMYHDLIKQGRDTGKYN